MSTRRLLVAMLASATLAGLPAAPASASATEPVAIWPMNEMPGAPLMLDSTGHHLNGRIGGEVRTHVTIGGATGYRFPWLAPDTPPPHREHLVVVPGDDRLNPGTRDYAVTVRLRTTYRFGNIIQKGQATVPGGYFKFQIPNGILQCLFRGSAGSLMVSSPRALNDGGWHTVRCARTGNRVTLIVDGRLVARRTGATGRIANSWPLTIGGKISCDQVDVTCDYYPGYLDRVEIDAGRLPA
jgi:Laminin G domain